MSPRRLISSGSPFEASYGYSRAVIDGDFVHVSGTTGYDYATMVMPEGAAAQAEACWRNIASVLAQANAQLADIVRADYYVTCRDDAVPVLEVCGRVLGDIRPAATIVIVTGLLTPEMLVEIAVTARIG